MTSLMTIELGWLPVELSSVGGDITLKTLPTFGDAVREVRDGMATRTPNLSDRRIVRVCLSGAGRERLEAIDAPLLAIHRSGFDGSAPAKLEALTALLRRLG